MKQVKTLSCGKGTAMTSISYNSAASAALRSLQMATRETEMREAHISSGKRVEQASDDASLWATSSALRSELKSLAAVRDAMLSSQTQLDMAATGFAMTRELLEDMRSKIMLAAQPGSDRTGLQSEIADLKKRIFSVARSNSTMASWMSADLSAPSATRAIVESYGSTGPGDLSISTREVGLASLALYDTSASGMDQGIIDGLQSMTDAAGNDLEIGGFANETGNRQSGGLVDATVVGTLVAGTASATGGLGTTPEEITQTGESSADGIHKGTVHTAALSYDRLVEGDVLTWRVTTKIGSTTETREAAVTYSATASPTTFHDDASLRSRLISTFDPAFVSPDVVSGLIFFDTTSTTAGDMVRLENVELHDASGIRRSRAAFAFAAAGDPTALEVSRPERLFLQHPNFGALAAGDTVRLKFDVNGASVVVRVTGAASSADFVAALNDDPAFWSKAEADIDPDGSKVVIRGSGSFWSGTGIHLEEVAFFGADGKPKVLGGTTFLNIADFAKFTFGSFDGPITFDSDDNITFDLRLDGVAAKMVRIDRALVDWVLGAPGRAHASSVVASAADYAAVIGAAIQRAGVTGLTASADNGRVVLTGSGEVGGEASIQISGSRISTGGQKMSVEKINVSAEALAALGATSQDDIATVLAAYFSVVSKAIDRTIAAEAKIASISRGIESQSSFLRTLGDIREQAISQLVDADISEEVIHLRVAQVREQLALQALPIANRKSADILKLFRLGVPL